MGVRSDLERNIADTEARLKNDIRQKQQEAFEKIGAVEQQAELRSAEASRRLGALDLRMSGVQGGLGEHKRDILKLREEVNGLTVKSASHGGELQKSADMLRKMEKQRNQDEQNWKAQMDAVHDVLDTKVNEKPFEDLKHCTASLTKGVVKFAQVVGVFPGPRFDDAEGADATEADIELLGWEDCAENMSPRRQGVAPAVLAAVPQHPGHDREEGGPFRVASPPDLTAAYRVAAGACEARARAVERGGGAPPAAAFAARALLEGQRGCKRHHRTGRSAVGARCPSSWAKSVKW